MRKPFWNVRLISVRFGISKFEKLKVKLAARSEKSRRFVRFSRARNREIKKFSQCARLLRVTRFNAKDELFLRLSEG